MASCCHILALVILVLALLSAAIGAGAPWVAAAQDRGDASGEALLLGLFERYSETVTVTRTGSGSGTRATTSDKFTRESWHSIYAGKLDKQHCPEDSSKTNRGAYSRIQAAEAFSILTIIFCLLHVIVCCCYASGRLNRCVYLITGIFTICFGICTLVSWDFFLNFCDENYCQRYVDNAEKRGGTLEQNFSGSAQGVQGSISGTDYQNAVCYYFVGFAFEIIAVGLVALAFLPMCLCGNRRSVHERVVYVDRQPQEPVYAA